VTLYLQTEVEVSSRDLVSAIVADPSVMKDVLRRLAQHNDRNGKLLSAAPQYAAALQVLEQAPDESPSPLAGVELWASAFRSFDSIDRDRALHELARVGGFRILA
jgi:hypothetical protein